MNEIETLQRAEVGVFVLASTDLTGPEMASVVVTVLPKMRPFIAKFYKDGRLLAWE